MRRLLILIALVSLTALALAQAGRAQDEIQLGTLEVNLWPEYDRSDMLVIYKVTLRPDMVPSDLTFRIPKEAVDPIVKIRAEDGNLYAKDFTYRSGSEWGEMTFQGDTSNFQIEYYDPRLKKQGSYRSFDYTWPGDYGAVSASIVVQLPWDASQMQFTSENVTSFTGIDKLTYYALQIGTLKKDQVFVFSLNYQKSSSVLTWEKVSVHPVGGKLPQSMWNRGLPWAMGVLAVLVIAVGVLFFWHLSQPNAGGKLSKPIKAAAPAGGDTAADESGVYCHRCGRRAALSDVFCRSCGTKLPI